MFLGFVVCECLVSFTESRSCYYTAFVFVVVCVAKLVASLSQLPFDVDVPPMLELVNWPSGLRRQFKALV